MRSPFRVRASAENVAERVFEHGVNQMASRRTIQTSGFRERTCHINDQNEERSGHLSGDRRNVSFSPKAEIVSVSDPY